MLRKIFLVLVLIISGNGVFGQFIRSYNIEVSCSARTINSTQSVLEFKWPYRAPVNHAQRVYRKTKDILGWGSAYRSLGNYDSTFNDTILTGSVFEYMFEKDSGYDGFEVYGYILAGNRLPVVLNRGKILLLVDSTHRSFLENDIRTFRNDLIGDGWKTELHWFDSLTTVAQIKSYIVSRYNADPANLKSVILLGNLAVPYSGDLRGPSAYFPPDGHTTTASPPSHEGAWPADIYYGCTGLPVWPDSTVSNTLGARAANNNVPNDGKFDYSSYLEHFVLNSLQIGRIDLANMSAFSLNERSLLRQYLNKNHRFRHKIDIIRERCLLDDNVGFLNYPSGNPDEHFATNAYRNMAPLIADSVTRSLDYLSTLDTDDYLWSFGFGTGSYINCSGIGNTGQFASSTQEIKSVFSGFFGSYFGDWDNPNNFLRAPLAAQGNVLNTFYVGRPPLFFHHMGMGETIGYSMLRSQNNIDTLTYANYLYPVASFCYLQTHVSLLGDPSVRMQPVMPASVLTAVQDSCFQRIKLNWTASSDTAVHLYYVSRATHIDSSFTLLGSTASTAFTDSFPLSGDNVYMIRGSKLQLSGSGSYFNLSQGIFDTARLMSLIANADTSVCLNQRVRLGTVNSNLTNVVYSWIPAAGNRDTFSLIVTASGSKILIATDTAGNCVMRDTFQLSTLSLPVSETISTVTNSCSDTVNWSSSLNNGAGFQYQWLFNGGNPSDTSGLGLDSPGMILYGSIGTYLTTLRVTNPATLCQRLDSQSVVVVCSSLPIELASINCLNTIKGKEMRFYIYDNDKYAAYKIEGYNGIFWESIKVMPSGNSSFYSFQLENVRQFEEIRLQGIDYNGETTDFGLCNWSEENLEWSLFPNPFSDEVKISYNGIHGTRVSLVRVVNSYGQEVYSEQFNFNDNVLNLNLKGFEPGIYTVIIETGDGVFTAKIVKI